MITNGYRTLLERECLACGNPFLVPPAEAKRSRAAFCSRTCGAAARKTRVPKPCEVCGTVFESRKKNARFCSQPCKVKSQVKVRTEEWHIKKRLNARIGSLMWYTLKGNKAGVSWKSLVGYTIADLRTHLESKFVNGMNWENMGQWHIDHIIPRKFFSFTSPNDAGFKQCWSLLNLQPLWETDNLKKGSSLPKEN